jgi:hypothetical protein
VTTRTPLSTRRDDDRQSQFPIKRKTIILREGLESAYCVAAAREIRLSAHIIVKPSKLIERSLLPSMQSDLPDSAAVDAGLFSCQGASYQAAAARGARASPR